MSFPNVQLKRVASLVNGKAFQPSDWSDDGVPIIRIQNLNGLDKPFNYWAGPLSKQVLVKPYDLLLAWSGTPGTSFGAHIWRDFDAVLNQHIFRVDLDENLITKEWAKFVINAHLNKLISQAHGGVGLKHVTRGMVEELEIPLPPLPEQKRIAAIIDQADALRAKRREALGELDKLTQSIFLDMFGDPARNANDQSAGRLGDYVKVHGGYAFKSDDFANTGFPVIRISNLTGDAVDLSNAARIPSWKVGKGAGYRINPGDILMAMSGATTGKIGVAPWNLNEPLYLNQRVGNFRIKDPSRVNKTFLLSFLRSDYYQKYLWGLAAGAAQPNISGSQLESALLPLPPIARQNEFEERIRHLSALGHSMNESERAMNEIFRALQHRAFRGEL